MLCSTLCLVLLALQTKLFAFDPLDLDQFFDLFVLFFALNAHGYSLRSERFVGLHMI